MYSRRGLGVEMISIMAWYLMIKRLFYCNTPSHPFAVPFPVIFLCRDAAACDSCPLGHWSRQWVSEDSPGRPVAVCACSVSCHHCTNADSPHLHCLTALLPSPRRPRPPPTSPLPRQDHPNISPRCFLKLPWVTGPLAQIMLACSGGASQRGQE